MLYHEFEKVLPQVHFLIYGPLAFSLNLPLLCSL